MSKALMNAKYNGETGPHFNTDAQLDMREISAQEKQEAYDNVQALIERTRQDLENE